MKIREKRLSGPGDNFWDHSDFTATVTEITISENHYGKTIVEEKNLQTNEIVRLLEIERKTLEN